LATGFQTYKEISNCCNSDIYRSLCLVVGGDKEGKTSFAVPDSSPFGCGTVSTGKRRLSARKYCLHFQDRTLVRY